jgi:hypothetical protein
MTKKSACCWTVAFWLFVVLTLTAVLNLKCTGTAGKDGKSVNADSLKTVIYSQMKGDPAFKGEPGVSIKGDKGEPGEDCDMIWFQEEMGLVDARLSDVSERVEQLTQWPYDSLRLFMAKVQELEQRLAELNVNFTEHLGPVGVTDSLGNICYSVQPDQPFDYQLRHNFLDTAGKHEWHIKFHTAVEEYNTLADMYAKRNAVTTSLDYKWHDVTYDRFLEFAITTFEGPVFPITVQLMLPRRHKYYVICHQAIDDAVPPNYSTWSRSIEQKPPYYVWQE